MHVHVGSFCCGYHKHHVLFPFVCVAREILCMLELWIPDHLHVCFKGVWPGDEATPTLAKPA